MPFDLMNKQQLHNSIETSNLCLKAHGGVHVVMPSGSGNHLKLGAQCARSHV